MDCDAKDLASSSQPNSATNSSPRKTNSDKFAVPSSVNDAARKSQPSSNALSKKSLDMPSKDILRQVEIQRTPRVMQLEGMFDLTTAKVSEQKWSVHLELPEKWNVGVIVGASGSGKTTVAKELFGANLVHGFDWSADKSIVDAFPKEVGIKDMCAEQRVVQEG
jgi:ABC-type glutathione transport system ATPase component